MLMQQVHPAPPPQSRRPTQQHQPKKETSKPQQSGSCSSLIHNHHQKGRVKVEWTTKSLTIDIPFVHLKKQVTVKWQPTSKKHQTSTSPAAYISSHDGFP
uniref:Uncharacterized protein n=1 Tax=Helianthus annuus TaxID=4232 RepID=A0A251UDW1_HELAN